MAIRVQPLPTRSNLRSWQTNRMPRVPCVRAFRGPVSRFCAVSALALLICATARAADPSVDRQPVTALADRYVAEFKVRFPIQYDYSGLAADRHDGVDINSPADLAKWRDFENRLDTELHKVQPDALAGQPEWVTWHFLNQALKQDT